MATLFDDFDPIAKGPGSVLDYEVTSGEALDTMYERGIDMNPMAYVVRQARYFSEDMGNIIGETDWVGADKARAEVKGRSLDLKIPDNGMSRYELDTLQYLKQREVNETAKNARPQGVVAQAAGLLGGFAAGATDPINIASSFIPIVPEARYSAWLARAGESFLARAAVRAKAGAIEGAVGAALVEPIVYGGAQAEQTNYGVADSFVNVMFGGILGGGLHVPAGAVYDARVGRALKSLDQGLRAVEFRKAATRAPDEVHLAALQQAATAVEADGPVRAAEVIAQKLGPERLRRLAEMPGETKVNGETIGTPDAISEDIAHFTMRRDDALRRGDADVAARWQTHLDEASAKAEAAPAAERVDSAAIEADGEIFTGQTHQQAVEAYAKAKGLSIDDAIETLHDAKLDGFITSEGRFVSRAEAADIARANAGEAPAPKGGPNSKLRDVLDTLPEITRGDVGPMDAKPRWLERLTESANQERTGEAFNRQFVDESGAAATRETAVPITADRWAAEEAESSARADEQLRHSKDETPEDIAADAAFAVAHLDSMRARGILGAEQEAMVRVGNEEADRMEHEASAYEAAGICDME